MPKLDVWVEVDVSDFGDADIWDEARHRLPKTLAEKLDDDGDREALDDLARAVFALFGREFGYPEPVSAAAKVRSVAEAKAATEGRLRP